MDNLAEKSRRVYVQWRNTLPQGGNDQQPSQTSSGTHALLPPSFINAHPSLSRYAEHIKVTTPSTALADFSSPARENNKLDSPTPAWLPDVYRFNSSGVGIDERYSFATAPATPFMPSEPRVAKNESFNFEYGALTAELEDTSYMAWF